MQRTKQPFTIIVRQSDVPIEVTDCERYRFEHVAEKNQRQRRREMAQRDKQRHDRGE